MLDERGVGLAVSGWLSPPCFIGSVLPEALPSPKEFVFSLLVRLSVTLAFLHDGGVGPMHNLFFAASYCFKRNRKTVVVILYTPQLEGPATTRAYGRHGSSNNSQKKAMRKNMVEEVTFTI